MILPTIFDCGFGAKALPRLFRGPAKVFGMPRCFTKLQLESLRRIPFDIMTFAIHFMHVLENHRPRMRERDVEGWKYANDCTLVVREKEAVIFSFLFANISIHRVRSILY